MQGLPPPVPTTLHSSITYPRGAIIPWKAATNKKDLRSVSVPRGFVRVDTDIVKLKPKSRYNSANHMVYVMYLRKVT